MFSSEFLWGFVAGAPIWTIVILLVIHHNAKLAGIVTAWLVKTTAKAQADAAPIIAKVEADAGTISKVV